MPDKDFDIIIIGAGLSGLTAGLCAAKNNKKVLILEKNNHIGGACTSFRRGRFEFEASLKSLGGFSSDAHSSDLYRILNDLGICNQIEWAEIPQAFRVMSKTQSGTDIDLNLPFGVENFINELDNAYAESKPSLIKLFELGDEVENAIKYIETIENEPTLSNIRHLKKDYGNFIRTAPYSVNEVLIALDIPKKVRDILTGIWLDYGIDCDKLSFTQFIYSLNSYIKYGSFIPKNRSTDIINTMAYEFKKLGGVIKTNSAVSRIIIKNNAAEGIILKDEERIYCRSIISSICPTTVCAKMIKEKDLPINAKKRTNARTFGPRSSSIYLGLNKSPEELGIKDYITYITDTNDSAKQYSLMNSIETNNAFIATCLNIANSSCSPKGTTILNFTTFYTDNCWANVQPEDYFDEKDLLAARFIANFEERTGVTIHNNIEELEVATPVTFARYLGVPQGVTFGYFPDDWDGIIPRIMTEKSDNDIKGLRFCGSFGTLLSGVQNVAASGRNAAFAAIADIEGGVN